MSIFNGTPITVGISTPLWAIPPGQQFVSIVPPVASPGIPIGSDAETGAEEFIVEDL
jgi:hypothetical protein